jgi:hypothetical protein
VSRFIDQTFNVAENCCIGSIDADGKGDYRE